MKTINVKCSNPYNIYLGSNIIHKLNDCFAGLNLGNNILIVTDDNVEKKYLNIVLEQLKDKYNVTHLVFENGEQIKQLSNLEIIINKLADSGFRRNDSIIALGGGVIGDISGLASSLYMRGINFIQIPTTLLSMVDASVGGKTAIDLKQGKNLLGSFYQPKVVICDTQIIKDLPKDVFNEGMGEVIKYNVIDDNPIIEYINNNQLDEKLEDIIEYCIRSKVDVVDKDEYETKGLRKILNAGHTYGHALEKASDYKLAHGVAVGTGLLYEAALSEKFGLCDSQLINKLKEALSKFDLIVKVPYSVDQLVNNMTLDKKNKDDEIVFMLPTQLGKTKEVKIDINTLKSLLTQIGEL